VSRWFRFYSGVVADPKAQMLSPEMFKHWVNVLCIAAQHGGHLPTLSITAFMLGRMAEPKAAGILAKLHSAQLLDKTETSFKPHNWDARQYKQDSNDPTNADRQKRFRNRKRNGSNGQSNEGETVTEKRPESTENTDAEARASGADAPIDHRKRLFNEGLTTLGRLTGKGPDACRSFVGKCLRASSDDAVTVLGLIEDAERNRVVDPSAWIAARLKPTENHNAKPKNAIIQAIDDLGRTIAGFDGPARKPDELRGEPGENPVRLLSHR
jgi:hypothetical protein